MCHSERAKRVEESSAYQISTTGKILRFRRKAAPLRMTPAGRIADQCAKLSFNISYLRKKPGSGITVPWFDLEFIIFV